MTVAIPGKSPGSYEIKSANLPLLALRLKSGDLDLLEQELQSFYGDLAGFFSNDPIVIDLSALPEEQAGHLPDLQRLQSLLRKFALNPIGIKPAQADQAKAISQTGLLDASALKISGKSSLPQDQAPAPASQAAAVADEPPVSGALVIDRPLRSGQQIYARGRDLVLLAMVNPGAEVIADGHIHVYAPLRGRALAGARGWPEACIFAQAMQPELVSIAGVYRTMEEALPDTIWGRAATVSLHSSEAGDKLLFNRLGS